MKKKLTLVTFAAAFAAMFGMNLDMAAAQFGVGPRLANQVAEPDTFRRVATDLNVGLPGRLWVSTNFADQGLGYTGSYVTVGGKTRVGEDFLDGRWLTEARLHHSIDDDGGFFANVGIERVFSLKAAHADISTGFWYDFDGDAKGSFGGDFSQVGVSASIKSRRWDLIGNGYFPVGVRNRQSEPTVGGTFFQGNNILLQPGIDSALTGFEVLLKLRPKQLAFMNGSFEFGGYGYSSDLVNSFGGGRVRLGAQTQRGIIVSAEVNHDDRFETTGVLSLGYVFGARGGRGSEYAGIGRDLEETNRNDHIVRFNQSVVLAIDPNTGAPFNVIHVGDGAADGGDGTAENPFNTLADVEANSGVGDVIFVATGGVLDGGLALQDQQQLLGAGVEQILEIQDNQLFRLGADTGGGGVLSNNGGLNVVTLANDNIVRGVTIDASGAMNGISADGTDNAIIENNNVSGADYFGVIANNVTGDIQINNNTFTANGFDGLLVQNVTDPNVTFEIDSNVSSGNLRDGIHFENFTSESITFSNNITNDNVRNGLFIEDYLTPAGEVIVVGHTSDGNAASGIFLLNGDGNFALVDSTITNNLESGVRTESFSNLTDGQSTFVGNNPTGVTVISGNGVGAGANLQFDLIGENLTQDVLVTGLTLDNGGRGVQATVNGNNSELNIDLIDIISISNNTGDGIQFIAEDGGVINTNILNQGALPLQISNNTEANGAGIFLSADGVGGINAAEINAVIDNVDILIAGSTFNSSGVEIASLGNAVVDISLSNANIEKSLLETFPTGGLQDNDIGIRALFANDGGGNVNELFVSNTTITTDNGIFIDAQANTFTDVVIEESLIQAAGDRVVQRVSDAPFDDNQAALSDELGFTEFGNRGIVIRADGDASNLAADNSTRVQIRDVTVQDFAGTVFGEGLDDEVAFGVLPTLDFTDFQNIAQAGAGIDIATTGDARLLLSISEVLLLNNGAGYDNDSDNDNLFDDTPVTVVEAPDQLFFFDALKINAFDTSIITADITNNFFQDNFERAIGINTYQGATINVVIADNAFENNDRGIDSDIILFPSLLADNPITFANSPFRADIEIINNEEFYFRPFEITLVSDEDGVPIDFNGDTIAQEDLAALGQPLRTGLALGTATINADISNNLFQTVQDIQDFSSPPGDLTIGVDGATNGIDFFTGNATLTDFGLTEDLLGDEIENFFALGFAAPIHD